MSIVEVALAVIAVLGALAAIGRAGHWLFTRLRTGFRTLDRIEQTLARELEHNGGGSMKDQSRRTVEEIADLRTELTTHMSISEADREELREFSRRLRADVNRLLEQNQERDRPGKRYGIDLLSAALDPSVPAEAVDPGIAELDDDGG